jgi:hypothetical protein
VFATDSNDTAVQDMMKIILLLLLDTLEMTEEDLDKSKSIQRSS